MRSTVAKRAGVGDDAVVSATMADASPLEPYVEAPVWRIMAGSRQRIYDWPRIARRYIEGFVEPGGDDGAPSWPTMAEIASHYGIHESVVREAARRQHWTTKREEFRVQLTREARALRAHKIAAASVKFDDHAIAGVTKAIRVVEHRFGDIEADQLAHAVVRDRYHELVADGMGDQAAREETGFNEWMQPVDARELHALAQAGLGLHTLKARAAGEVTGRLEISGVDGGPIELHSTVAAELGQDDVGRLEDFFASWQRARVGADAPLELPGGMDEVFDAELVDDV